MINKLLPPEGLSWIVQRGGAFPAMARAVAGVDERHAGQLLEVVERCEASLMRPPPSMERGNLELGRQALLQGARELFESGYFPVNDRRGRAWCLEDGNVLLDRVAWWHSCKMNDIDETPEIDDFVEWAQARLPCRWNADHEMMRLRRSSDQNKNNFVVWDVMSIGGEALHLDLDHYADGFTCDVIPLRDKSLIVRDNKEDNVKNETVNCSSDSEDEQEPEEKEKTTDNSSTPLKPTTILADRPKNLWDAPSVLTD